MLKNIQSYRYQNEIYQLQQLSNDVVRVIPWNDVIQDLRTRPPVPEGSTETWYLVMKNEKDSFVNSSNEGLEPIEEENDNMDISWLFIKIFDRSLSEEKYQYFHPLTIQHTSRLTNIVQGMKGVVTVGFHFVLPNSKIPPHTDYDKSNWYHILITPDIDIHDVTMSLPGTTFKLERNQIVIFDASNLHSIENKSKDNFVCLVLMVESEYFND